MKKLPVGIQSIRKILEQDYVYVDKTDIIYKLINEGQYYFLSRPRRFGKSLLLSTLKEIFKGDKELFKGCHIYNTDYDWKKYPIIYFDFVKIPTRSPKKLMSFLTKILKDTALSYNKSIKCPNIEEGLANLVTALSDLGPVVVLIDEYDKPLVDNLERIDIAKENQHLLKDFYGALKGFDDQLRFVFATGVTKFSKVSLFSGFNNLYDITTDRHYATLLGYTAPDLQNFLSKQITQVANELRPVGETAASTETVLADMKEWYNGYRFSRAEKLVYNPHSVLNFLKTGTMQSYWFETGTTTLLVQQIRKQPSSVMDFGGSVAGHSNFLDIDDLQLDLIPLMWQSGYLTIRDYDEASGRYKLDFPNREVRGAFFETLVHKFAGLGIRISDAALQCQQQLERREFVPFIEAMKSLFARIPNTLFKHESEASYHAIFLIILEAMGLRVQAELQTNMGRIDLVIEMQSCIYIIELKFNKDADEALKQIVQKDYKQRYATKEKDLVLMGVNFSSTTRNISNCRAIVYNKDGSTGEEVRMPA